MPGNIGDPDIVLGRLNGFGLVDLTKGKYVNWLVVISKAEGQPV